MSQPRWCGFRMALATPGTDPERRFCAHVHGPAVRAHGGLASTLCGSVRLAGVSRCRGCCCIRPALWSGVTRMQMSGWLFHLWSLGSTSPLTKAGPWGCRSVFEALVGSSFYLLYFTCFKDAFAPVLCNSVKQPSFHFQ